MQPLIYTNFQIQSDSRLSSGDHDASGFSSRRRPYADIGGAQGSWFERLCAKGDAAAKLGFLAYMGLLAVTALYGMSLNGSLARVTQAMLLAADGAARDNGLVISKIVVKGRGHVAESDIVLALDIRPEQSIFGFDTRAARARLEAIGWIRSAEIRRLLPSTLIVDVREREPVAILRRGEERFAIDAAGLMLGPVKPGEMSALVEVSGDDAAAAAADLAAALAAHPTVRARLVSAERISARRWDLLLRDGVRAKLPAAQIDEALSRLGDIIALEGLPLDAVLAVDLRAPGQAALKLKPGSEDARGRIAAAAAGSRFALDPERR